MSLAEIKSAMAAKKMRCPQCQEPVQSFEKFVQMIESAYDGPDSSMGNTTDNSKVTLICANGTCPWRERTEYWRNYITE